MRAVGDSCPSQRRRLPRGISDRVRLARGSETGEVSDMTPYESR